MNSNARANIAQPNMSGDDLRCMICTKATKFSDISHLLTHISSKQHLSNYFKIRVAADEDENAQNLLQRFDSWFEKWNMGTLLRERLHQKERKKAGARAAPRKPAASSSSLTGARKKARSNENDAVGRHKPQISSTLPDRSFPQANFNGVPIGLHYNPAAAFQPSFPSVSGWSATEPQIKVEPDDGSSEADDFDSMRSAIPAYFLLEHTANTNDDDSAIVSSSLHSSTFLEEAAEEEKDMTKLKGIIWPGMNLFDSATPEMQRKRNQKKAVNVVAQLQAASLGVEPEESIYNTVGEFLKLREITGDPATINSPLKGETTPEPDTPPVKKKRGPARRSREALRELDVNAPHAIRRRKEPKRKHNELESEDFDDEMTYQMAKYRRKNGIRIHRDDSGPDITFEQQPMPMSYLTSGFGYGSGLSKSFPGRDRVSSRPSTPFTSRLPTVNPHLRQHGHHDAHNHHYPPAYDLSAFGQLTNFLHPSMFQGLSAASISNGQASTSTLPSFQSTFAQDAHLNLPVHSTTGMNGFNQNVPNWDVFNSGNGSTDRLPAPHSFSGYPAFDLEHADINPLFLHSDQAFTADGEQQPQVSTDVVIKQEKDMDKDSNADTISLASDQR